MDHQPRVVAVLFGPPGAGKTTAARASGLQVFDRDDQPWRTEGEGPFRRALQQLAHDDHARAVVIRAGATPTARMKDLILVAATHAWVITTPPELCHRRVQSRHRPGNLRAEHAAVSKWWTAYQPDDVPAWPGEWPDLDRPSAVGQWIGAAQPTCPRCGERHRPDLDCWQNVRKGVSPAVFAVHGRRCHLCGRGGATSVDHLRPRMFGGSDELDNLRPAHLGCNAQRGALPLAPAADPAAASTVSPRWT